MKKKFFSTLVAVSALFFVTGLVSCSDDDANVCEEFADWGQCDAAWTNAYYACETEECENALEYECGDDPSGCDEEPLCQLQFIADEGCAAE